MVKTKNVSNVTFTSIATILIPIGVGLLDTNILVGLLTIVLGIVSLVLREVFKSA